MVNKWTILGSKGLKPVQATNPTDDGKGLLGDQSSILQPPQQAYGGPGMATDYATDHHRVVRRVSVGTKCLLCRALNWDAAIKGRY